MSFPVSLGLNVDRIGGPLSTKSGSSRRSAFCGREVNENRFSRVSEAVTCDHKLDDIDVRIYCALTSGITNGNVSTVSTRRIEELTGKSRSAIVESIKLLAERGHIIKSQVKSGMRASYKLTAPVFNNGKVSSLSGTLMQDQVTRPALAKCAECRKPRVLAKTGWCKKCEEKHDRVREMEGVVVRMISRELIA